MKRNWPANSNEKIGIRFLGKIEENSINFTKGNGNVLPPLTNCFRWINHVIDVQVTWNLVYFVIRSPICVFIIILFEAGKLSNTITRRVFYGNCLISLGFVSLETFKRGFNLGGAVNPEYLEMLNKVFLIHRVFLNSNREVTVRNPFLNHSFSKNLSWINTLWMELFFK